MNKKYSVFIGPAEIAGYYTNLHKGLLELGHNATYMGLNYQTKVYEIHANELLFVKIYKSYKNKASEKKGTPNLIYNLLSKVCFIPVIVQILFKIDVLIFGFDSSLLPNKIDLPLWKFFRKKVILGLFHGSEARPPFIDGVNFDTRDEFISNTEILKRVKSKVDRLAQDEKYANYIIASPTCSQYLKMPFINYFQFGLTVKVMEENYSNNDLINKPDVINIFHAPSNLSIKGTSIIREVISKLESRYPVHYIEIHGKPVKEVYKHLQNADLVIDQIYSDTPMSGLATEAAFFEVPALVGGYKLTDIIESYIPGPMVPPTFICKPEDFEETLTGLLESPEKMKEMGKRAGRFVREVWSYKVVAEKYERLFNDDFPREWLLNPYDVIYTAGGGISTQNRNRIIRDFVNEFGINSLGLNEATKNKILEELQE